MTWRKVGHGRWRSSRGDLIERSSSATALRTWYIIGGDFAHGRGLAAGLCGGFFQLGSAKAAIDRARSTVSPE
jgi:hypothetical protein